MPIVLPHNYGRERTLVEVSNHECVLSAKRRLRSNVCKNANPSRQHVWEDIPPYVCTYSECLTANQRYSRRREWHRHQTKMHNRLWLCPFGCSDKFSQEPCWQEHVRKHHGQSYDQSTQQRISESCVIATNDTAEQKCPLCQKTLATPKVRFKHLGHHLEQLALHALPQHVLSNESEGDEPLEHDSEESAGSRNSAERDAMSAPIGFKDAVGRKYSFPFHLCKTWEGMEDLIKQAFLHVDIVGEQVRQGHYDLFGQDGVIILPEVWETFVQPGWEITMQMWPMPEPSSSSHEDRSVPSKSRSPRNTPSATAKSSRIPIPVEPYYPSSPSRKSNAYICDSCDKEVSMDYMTVPVKQLTTSTQIRGSRYECQSCDNFHLCRRCFDDPSVTIRLKHTHPKSHFVEIRGELDPQQVTKRVIEEVRVGDPADVGQSESTDNSGASQVLQNTREIRPDDQSERPVQANQSLGLPSETKSTHRRGYTSEISGDQTSSDEDSGGEEGIAGRMTSVKSGLKWYDGDIAANRDGAEQYNKEEPPATQGERNKPVRPKLVRSTFADYRLTEETLHDWLNTHFPEGHYGKIDFNIQVCRSNREGCSSCLRVLACNWEISLCHTPTTDFRKTPIEIYKAAH